MSNLLNVYVAGAYHDRERVSACMQRVIRAPNMRLTHQWVEIIDVVKKVHGDEHDTAITDQDRESYALGDLHRLRQSDVLWFAVPSSGGRGCWFEDGVAWAWRIPMIASGPASRASIFTQLSEAIFVDDEDAFAWLLRLAAERRG